MGCRPYITQNVSITELFSPLRLILQIVSLIRLLIMPAHFGALSALTTLSQHPLAHIKPFFLLFCFVLSITGLCQVTCACLVVAGGSENRTMIVACCSLALTPADVCRLFQKAVLKSVL